MPRFRFAPKSVPAQVSGQPSTERSDRVSNRVSNRVSSRALAVALALWACGSDGAFAGAPALPNPSHSGNPGLERALSWVPEGAVSFVVVPSLKAMSDDIAQLVEATGQGGVLSMGRPIDLLKAQLGVGANLDEKGPAVAYFPAVAAGEPAAALPAVLPVVLVPTTDGAAFIAANLTPAAAAGDGAYLTGNGTTVFAAALDGCVALAPSRATLPTALPARGIGERFHARLKPAETAWLERADLVAWGSRDAMHAAVEKARATPLPDADGVDPTGALGGFSGTREAQEATRRKALEIADMLADGLVVVDVDPLGVFLATLGVAEPATPLAAVTAGGAGKPARFDRLPQSPFYLALSADIDGLGGAARFGELMDLAGLPRTALPEWFFTEGADIRAVQLGAFPSKLGVAMGGALNDSALFVASRDPARTLARIRQSIESLAGESAGVRREPSWNPDKKLKSGESVIAFEVKETVVDASQRPGLDYERLAKQFIFGARGLNGLIKQRDDGIVVTFSQRPDVYSRALEAAAGTRTLAGDGTVRSIEEWLPEDRDVEAMVGIGPLVNLVAQIASSFVGEEQVKSMMPAIDRDANPIAVAIDLDQGRARAVTVLPADVLKAMAAAAASANRGGAGAPVAAPAPATKPAPAAPAAPEKAE